MFTGIVEELGAVAAIEKHSTGARLTIRCRTVLQDASEGASIAVNGTCLTALALTADSFSADLAPETLALTNLGDLHPGSAVNLERSVTPTTRLSGHIVQGHVDGKGQLITLDPLGEGNWWMRVRVPQELDRYLVKKGSITIDGISLTIAMLEEASINHGPVVGVTIIPHTYANTTIGSAQPGDYFNIEVDILAKHLEKLLASRES